MYHGTKLARFAFMSEAGPARQPHAYHASVYELEECSVQIGVAYPSRVVVLLSPSGLRSSVKYFGEYFLNVNKASICALLCQAPI